MLDELHVILKNVPDELYKFILDEQVRLKIERKSTFSLGSTVLIMLRDYKNCRESNNYVPDGEN